MTAALLFDCDGTLVDTAHMHFTALEAALGRHGLTIDMGWYLARTGWSQGAMFEAFERARARLPVAHAELSRAVTDELQGLLGTVRAMEPVAAVARAARGRVPMAVCSNGERLNVLGSLRSAGLVELFDAIVTIEDVKRGKPAPDVYLRAAELLATPPGQCLVFEDSNEGLEAARAAGMQAVDVRPFLAGHVTGFETTTTR